jgi:hypothetical protein
MERPTVKTQSAITGVLVTRDRPGRKGAAFLSCMDAGSFPSHRVCSLCQSRPTFLRYKVFARDTDGGAGCCLRCLADLLRRLEDRAIAVDGHSKVADGVLRSQGAQR